MKFICCLIFLIGSLVFSSCGASHSRNTEQTPQSLAIKATKPSSPVISDSNRAPAIENREEKAIDLSSLTQDEKENLLYGDWMVHFPTPNLNWGFSFKRDHRFNYVDNSVTSLKQRYRWTTGNWRLTENNLEIQITSYTIQDSDPIEGPFGLDFPPESKLIQKSVGNDTWFRIGTLESLRIGLVNAGVEYPPKIVLLPVLFDKVQESPMEYYQFTND